MIALVILIVVGLIAWWIVRRYSPRRIQSRASQWAWGLLVASLPVALLAIAGVELIAEAMGMSMGTPQNHSEVVAQNWLNVAVFVAISLPLIASVIVGLRTWRDERQTSPMVAALLSAALLVGCVILTILSWT